MRRASHGDMRIRLMHIDIKVSQKWAKLLRLLVQTIPGAGAPEDTEDDISDVSDDENTFLDEKWEEHRLIMAHQHNNDNWVVNLS
jgi:hypothetical protein